MTNEADETRKRFDEAQRIREDERAERARQEFIAREERSRRESDTAAERAREGIRRAFQPAIAEEREYTESKEVKK
ncbi:MAG TPA: hypothetical protein VJ110_03895 [Candidatus Nanoarchaeia archaeon]|nr:hypothetical protein [Candidatus Nanoarchaeia archaeon]